MLAHLVCPHGFRPALELWLAGAYLELPHGQISVLRVDVDDPLLCGWGEGCGSTIPLLRAKGKRVTGGELLCCLASQPGGVAFGNLERLLESLASTPRQAQRPGGKASA